MADHILVHLSRAETALLQKALVKELRACPEEGAAIDRLFQKLNAGEPQLYALLLPAEFRQ